MDSYYTLITGSSSGIGKAYALECARRGMNLLLVSRPSPRLESAANEIKNKYPVDVQYLAVDLTESDGPDRVFEWSRKNNFRVNYLINNAGTVGTFPFDKCEPGYIDSLILLNIRALTFLTRLFLPELKKYPGSKILNVGSMSGFFPVPYKSVYAASKAYVHSFSKSLAAELEGTGVKVYLVAPNGVQSNPRVIERIKDHKLMGAIVSVTAEKFAKQSLDKVERGKVFYIPLLSNKFLFGLSRILPNAVILKLLKKEFSKELGSEKVEPDARK